MEIVSKPVIVQSKSIRLWPLGYIIYTKKIVKDLNITLAKSLEIVVGTYSFHLRNPLHRTKRIKIVI